MKQNSHGQSDGPDEAPELPPQLQAALREAYRPPHSIDASVDQAILAEAREHLNGNSKATTREATPQAATSSEKPRWLTGAWISVATVAAALLLAAGLAFRMQDVAKSRELVSATQPNVANGVREDLDGNGRVDILDAFLLARKLDEGSVDDKLATWDLNRDGKVDQSDVQHAAMLAVRLNNSSTKG